MRGGFFKSAGPKNTGQRTKPQPIHFGNSNFLNQLLLISFRYYFEHEEFDVQVPERNGSIVDLSTTLTNRIQ
jgi:hypothetical protein